MYRAIGPAGRISGLLPPVFYFLLLLYVPGELGEGVLWLWFKRRVFGCLRFGG
jgi:hypothetical protein